MKLKSAVLFLAVSAVLAATTIRLVAEPTSATQAAAAHRAGSEEDLPTFGIKFTGPADWDRVPEAGVSGIARWIQPGPDGKAKAVFTIEHSRITAAPQTSDEIDRTLQREWQDFHTKITIKGMRSYQVDGEFGFIMEGSTAQDTLEMLVTYHGKVRYITTLQRRKANKDDVAIPEDNALMKQFMQTWKWRDLEEPFEHIHFMDKPLPVLGGLMQINVPITARLMVSASPKSEVDFAIANLKRQADELHVYVNVEENLPLPRDEYTALLVKNLSLVAPPTWTNMDGHCTITPWVKSNVVKRPVWMAFSVVPLGANRTATAIFALDRDEENVQDAYMAVAKRISLSIEPGHQTAAAQ